MGGVSCLLTLPFLGCSPACPWRLPGPQGVGFHLRGPEWRDPRRGLRARGSHRGGGLRAAPHPLGGGDVCLLAHSGPLRPPRLERGCLLLSQAHGQYLPNRGSMSSAVLWCRSQVSSSAGQRWWPCPSYPLALLPETVGLSHALYLFAGASPVCGQRLRREDRGGPVSRAPTYLSSQAGPS